jgi:hypothetical protein
MPTYPHYHLCKLVIGLIEWVWWLSWHCVLITLKYLSFIRVDFRLFVCTVVTSYIYINTAVISSVRKEFLSFANPIVLTVLPMSESQVVEVLVVWYSGCGSHRISVLLPGGSRNIAWFPYFSIVRTASCFAQKCYRICCKCTLIMEN